LKLVACLLLLSGFFIVLVALVLLASIGQRFAFIVAGFGVEVLGVALLTQSYRPTHKEQQ
jgi:uncharacterized membrane protein